MVRCLWVPREPHDEELSPRSFGLQKAPRGRRENEEKRDKARVEPRLEAEAEALPHKPSLQSVVASCKDKNKAADDTVFAFTGASISLNKLDHPASRSLLPYHALHVETGP